MEKKYNIQDMCDLAYWVYKNSGNIDARRSSIDIVNDFLEEKKQKGQDWERMKELIIDEIKKNDDYTVNFVNANIYGIIHNIEVFNLKYGFTMYRVEFDDKKRVISLKMQKHITYFPWITIWEIGYDGTEAETLKAIDFINAVTN